VIGRAERGRRAIRGGVFVEAVVGEVVGFVVGRVAGGGTHHQRTVAAQRGHRVCPAIGQVAGVVVIVGHVQPPLAGAVVRGEAHLLGQLAVRVVTTHLAIGQPPADAQIHVTVRLVMRAVHGLDGVAAQIRVGAQLMAVRVVGLPRLHAQVGLALGDVHRERGHHQLVARVVVHLLAHHVASLVGLDGRAALERVRIRVDRLAHDHVAGRVVFIGVGRRVVRARGHGDVAVHQRTVVDHDAVVGVVGEPFRLDIGGGRGGRLRGLYLGGLHRGGLRANVFDHQFLRPHLIEGERNAGGQPAAVGGRQTYIRQLVVGGVVGKRRAGKGLR